MNGFNFPEIFKTTSNGVSILEDSADVIKDLKLLFESEVGEFRYDPGYGSNVKLLRFRPKNQLTLDLLVDAITEAQMFIPNIMFDRDSVKVEFKKAGEVDFTISARIDNNNYITELILIQKLDE